MSQKDSVRALDMLVGLRELEVEQLSTDLSRKREARDRYARNISRLQELADGAGASGVLQSGSPGFSPALSLNCGGYKQSVLQMMEEHKVDLTLHEADMVMSQKALTEAVVRNEALDLALRQKLERIRRGERRHEAKQEDRVAEQMWWRVHR